MHTFRSLIFIFPTTPTLPVCRHTSPTQYRCNTSTVEMFQAVLSLIGTQLVDREGVVMARRHSRVHPGDLEEGGGTGGPRREGKILKATSGSNLTHQVCATWFFIFLQLAAASSSHLSMYHSHFYASMCMWHTNRHVYSIPVKSNGTGFSLILTMLSERRCYALSVIRDQGK